MWPSIPFEVIFHILKDLRLLNISIHKDFKMNVLKRKELKSRSVRVYFVRCRRTKVLNKTQLNNPNLYININLYHMSLK